MQQPERIPPESMQPKLVRELFTPEPEFSLVLGGPLYRLFLGTRLIRPPLQLIARRILVLSLICWLPPLVLSALAGHLETGVRVPFMLDPEVHVKFLFALPLLIATELLVHDRMHIIFPQFERRGIILPEDQPRFQNIAASAMRLRNSVIAEIVLLVLVSTVGYWMWRQHITLNTTTWYAVDTGAGLHLTAAGRYYAFVSLAIFRFILFRWYFRLFIWYDFLWHVKSLPLHLNLYHPDRAGGLGFLSESLAAFAPIFIAQSAVISAVIYDKVHFAGEKLPAFKFEIAAALLLFALFTLLPMGFFGVQLAHAGRVARPEFGALASRYVDDFRAKWIQHKPQPDEPLLGTSDIQSLADLANSFAVVNGLRLMPISKEDLIRLVVLIILPFVPLVLTMIPLAEIVERLFKLAF